MTTPIPVPSVGRIVHYTLTEADAEAINRRRADAANSLAQHREAADGTQVHAGNRAKEGDVLPMLIVRVWNEVPGTVNGQVFLDGNDTLWVTSVTPGDGPRRWAWPPRV